MTNMFDLQAEIASEIAGTLAASLSDKEKKQLERKPTENLVAYDLYLQAESLSKAFSPKSDRLKGIALYKEAIALDPAFSLAYEGLASAYAFGFYNMGAFPGNYLDTALVKAQKSVDLGPEYYETWKTLGTTYMMLGKREQSATMYKRALEINPNASAPINNLANYYVNNGQYDKAIEMYKKSIRVKAPIDSAGYAVSYSNLSTCYRILDLAENALYCAQQAIKYKEFTNSLLALGAAHYFTGDTAAAFQTAARIPEVENHSIPSLFMSSVLYYEYFDQEKGVEYLNELKEKENFRYEDYPSVRTYEALEIKKAGQYDAAQIMLNENLELYLTQFERGRRLQTWIKDIALIYLALDQEKEAFKWLEKLVDDGFMDYDQINESRLFDPVKDHPEYLRIMGGWKERLDEMRQRVIDQEASEQLRRLKM